MNKFLYYLLIPFFIISCGKSFLDREPSYYSNKTEAYSSIEAIQSALNGCYDGLQDYRYYGRNFYLMTEVYTDNAKLSSTNLSNFSSFYSYSLTSSTTELDGFWKIAYKIIARANNVIDATTKLQNVAYSKKKQILGEAYAIRALVYFDLVRVFAQTYAIKNGVDSANGAGGHLGIPIVTIPNTKDSLISPKRQTVDSVYKLIKSDFLKADTMLMSISVSKNVHVFSKEAVDALLSRVFLVMEDWYNAYSISSSIILSKEFSLVKNSDYINSWSQSSNSESIFSISYQTNDNIGTNSLGYMLSRNGYGGISQTTDLYALYDDYDIRKKLYFKVNSSDIFVSKYPGKLGVLGIDNIPVIRFSEMYFICAEALARLGSSKAQDMARGLLLEILTRSDNTVTTIDVTGHDLINVILNERRKELAFEGQRFFDLKRLQKAIIRNDCKAPICTLHYPSYLFAMPIPISEVNANKNMVQNSGY